MRRAAGPTDDEIVADLAARPDEQWRELFTVAGALTDADREVAWGGGNEVRPGVTHMPYPIYSEPIGRIRALLPIVVFDWGTWVSDSPLFPDGRGLDQAPVADAVRLATAYIRGERFIDGAIESAIGNGALAAIIDRLRRWFESGR